MLSAPAKILVVSALIVPFLFPGLVSGQQPQTEEFVVYQPDHQTVDELDRLLRPLLPPDANVRVVLDRESNELLVRGSAEVQRIVRELLKTADRPAVKAADNVPAQIRLYRVAAARLDRVKEDLERLLGDDQVKISMDRRNEALLVLAKPSTHERVVAWLDAESEGEGADGASGVSAQGRNGVSAGGELRPPSGDRPGTGLSGGSVETQPRERGAYSSSNRETSGESPATVVQRFLPLPRKSVTKIHTQVLQLLEQRIELGGDGLSEFVLRVESGEQIEVRLEEERAALLVRGDRGLVDQFERLIEVLVTNEFSPERRSRLLLLQREAQEQLRPYLKPMPDGAGANAAPRARQVSFQQELPAGESGDISEDDQEGSLALPQFDGVEVESLPDLDVIILRGRDQELQQLSDIIRQLEQISRETQAEITVLPLRHAGSVRVAEVIQDAQQDLVGARQGRVSVTPLGKPNALLLIGWGEAVKAVSELAGKLDRPVDPATQFEVFRLRHASATTVVQTLTSFFSNRDGLGTELQVTSDSRSNSVIVYAPPRDMAEVRRMIERLDTARGERVRQVRVIPIRNSMAEDVAATLEDAITAATSGGIGAAMELLTLGDQGQKVLQSGILQDVQITVNVRNNSLVVTSSAENFELLEGLIEQLDTPGVLAKIKIFPVVNGDAASLVQTLRSLIPSQTTGQVAPQLSSAPGETNLAPLRFTVDVRSNSIIATGSEGDLRIVEALIVRLDEGDSMQRKSAVYHLKNAPAVDVALAINEFLRNKRQVETAGPGDANPFQQLEKEVVVVPEPVANKLILSATPRYFEEIEELIEKLDEQPPEVMIQVLIAEVSLGDADEFGVELGIQDSVLFDRSLLGELLTTTSTDQTSTAAGILTSTQQIIQAATNVPGFDFNSTQGLGNSGSNRSLATAGAVGGQGISNFAVGRGNDELGFGGLVLSASSQNVSVLVRALQESRRIEILSRPQVRTLDNQPAFIQVGQRVPRIIGSTVNQNGQSNNVSLENVGLILGVTPRISPDGTVVMEIDAEKSQLGPEDEGIPVSVSVDGTVIRSPRIDTTTAQATVSAANGETIILGGLITKNRQEVHRKVPFLGDIPIVDSLFRFDSVIERRTELLIILTPRVIRDSEDNERLKQTELARMSWCASDVYDMHGDIGYVLDPTMVMPEDVESEVIYPDVTPGGKPKSPLPIMPPDWDGGASTDGESRPMLFDVPGSVRPADYEVPEGGREGAVGADFWR